MKAKVNFTFGGTLGRKREGVNGKEGWGEPRCPQPLATFEIPSLLPPSLTCLQVPSTVLKRLSSPIQHPFSIPTLDLQKNWLPFPQAANAAHTVHPRLQQGEKVSGHSQTLLRYHEDSVAGRGKTRLS